MGLSVRENVRNWVTFRSLLRRAIIQDSWIARMGLREGFFFLIFAFLSFGKKNNLVVCWKE